MIRAEDVARLLARASIVEAFRLSRRGYAPLVAAALCLSIFAVSVRYWWLTSRRSLERSHAEFEELVASRTSGRNEPEYSALVVQALSLGYVDIDTRCGDSDSGEAEGTAAEACSLAEQNLCLALGVWNDTSHTCVPRAEPVASLPVTKERLRANASTLLVPRFLLPAEAGPTEELHVASRVSDAVSFWLEIRGRVQINSTNADDNQGALEVAQVYFVSVDGVVGLYTHRGETVAEVFGSDTVDLRARPYVIHSEGRRGWANRYTMEPYLDLAGIGAVRTECVEVRDYQQRRGYLGALCVDFALPVSQAGESFFVDHALVRVAAADREPRFVGETSFSEGDRELIRARLRGTEAVLADSLRDAVQSRGAALDVDDIAAVALSAVRDSSSAVEFDGVIAMRGEGTGFWALVPLRRYADGTLDYVAIRPRPERVHLSFYVAIALGFLSVVVSTWAVRTSMAAKEREAEAGVLQSLQVGVIMGAVLTGSSPDAKRGPKIDHANDRAEELLGEPLRGIDGEGQRRAMTEFFHEKVLLRTSDGGLAPGDMELIELQRRRGEKSRYYVRKKEPDRGSPRTEWLCVDGSPQLDQDRRSFATVTVPTENELSEIHAVLEAVGRTGGET